MNYNRYLFHSKEIELESIEFENVTNFNTLNRFKTILRKCRNLLRHAFIIHIFVQQNNYSRLFEVKKFHFIS